MKIETFENLYCFSFVCLFVLFTNPQTATLFLPGLLAWFHFFNILPALPRRTEIHIDINFNICICFYVGSYMFNLYMLKRNGTQSACAIAANP